MSEVINYQSRDKAWIMNNIGKLAELNRLAWCDPPWFEEWDMDPNGTDERNNSYALIRYLVDHGAQFFSATSGENILGVGVTLPLDEAHLSKVEWRDPADFNDRPRPGDLELHLVFVHPAHRNRGIFRKLADMRLDYIQGNYGLNNRIWLQTVDTENSTVIKFYTGLGFRVVGRMTIKTTTRVFMLGTVADLNRVGEQFAS